MHDCYSSRLNNKDVCVKYITQVGVYVLVHSVVHSVAVGTRIAMVTRLTG